jgi:hypothetical protein
MPTNGHDGDIFARVDGVERISERLCDHAERMADQFGKLLVIVEKMTGSQAEFQGHAGEYFTALATEIKALAEAQQQTGERINVLIKMLEGWMRKQSSKGQRS